MEKASIEAMTYSNKPDACILIKSKCIYTVRFTNNCHSMLHRKPLNNIANGKY